jgi:adenosine kinase
MTDTRFDVLAIGNAIVDIIADTDDAFIASEGLTKGSMQLIDEARAQAFGDHASRATSIMSAA